jgi:O-phosphoseryl-tRNA(Cys) synthetase
MSIDQNKINKFYEDLFELTPEQQIPKLKELYKLIWESYKKGVIDREELAYEIAGTMAFEATQSGELGELTELAGELELPEGHVGGNADEKYKRLVELIEKFVNRE